MSFSIQASDGEPRVSDLIYDLWCAKIYIVCSVAVALLVCFLIVMICTPHYKTEALLAPPDNKMQLNFRGVIPDDANFAVDFLADRIGVKASADFLRFQHVLRGPRVAEKLLSDPLIVQNVTVHKRFPFSTPVSFKAGDDSYNVKVMTDYLQKHIKMTSVDMSTVRRLRYDHPDREFAAYILNMLYKETDALLKTDAQLVTENRTKFLRESLKKATNPDHRDALSTLLVEQEHVNMLLVLDEAFAAYFIDSPISSYKPVWPNKFLFYSIFGFIGIVCGLIIYQLRARTRGLV